MTVILRSEYIAGNVSHADYYGQFVNESVIRTVEGYIGKAKIVASTDPHFNDIPLEKWDALQPAILSIVGTKLGEANGTGGVSLSDTVCVAKAAARVIKEKGQ